MPSLTASTHFSLLFPDKSIPLRGNGRDMTPSGIAAWDDAAK